MLIRTLLQFVALLYVDTMADGAPTGRCFGKTPQFFDGTKCRDCITCKPGYGLSEVCGNGDGVNAYCQPCPTGSFSNSDSVDMCQPCTICPTEMRQHEPCMPMSDRKCVPCKCGLVKDQCGSCVNVINPNKPTLGPNPPNTFNPAAIAIYVAIPLALVFVLLGVFYFKKDIWDFLKRTCASNHRDEATHQSNPARNGASTHNTEEQHVVGLGEHIIIQEEQTPLKAVPEDSDCSVSEGRSEFDYLNSAVSPTFSTGTQTSSFPYDVFSGNRRWEFEEKLQRAIEETKDTPLGDMRQVDVDLLDRYLQAKGVVAKYHSTSEPNYLSIAKMYDIDKFTQRGFESVTDVIDHIANTDRTHPTVADFLKKVYDSHECFQALVKLVEQILDRTKACQQSEETWV